MSLLLVHPAFPSASAATGSFSSLLPDQSLDSFGQDLNTTSPVGIPHQPTIHVIDNCTEMSGLSAHHCLLAFERGTNKRCALQSDGQTCTADTCVEAKDENECAQHSDGLCKWQSPWCIYDADHMTSCSEDVVETDVKPLQLVCTETSLLVKMQQAADQRQSLRVIGAGWSYNTCPLPAAGAGSTVVLAGPLHNEYYYWDPIRSLLMVSGGMRTFEIYRLLTAIGMDWYTRGYCMHWDGGQTIGGILANNVNHHFTPTSYNETEALDLGVFVSGVATIVHASRSSNRELFESAFGGAGMSGIIVRAYLRIRPALYYQLWHEFPQIEGKLGYASQLMQLDMQNSRPLMPYYLESVPTWVNSTFTETMRRIVLLDSMPAGCKPARVIPGTDQQFYNNDSCAVDYTFATTTPNTGIGVPTLKDLALSGQEYSIAVRLADAPALASCFDEVFAGNNKLLIGIFPRQMPRSGGGYMTANARGDAINFDVSTLDQEASIHESLIERVIACAVAREPKMLMWQHPGKAQAKLPRSMWGIDVDRFVAVLDTFDPGRTFSSDIIHKSKLYFASALALD